MGAFDDLRRAWIIQWSHFSLTLELKCFPVLHKFPEYLIAPFITFPGTCFLYILMEFCPEYMYLSVWLNSQGDILWRFWNCFSHTVPCSLVLCTQNCSPSQSPHSHFCLLSSARPLGYEWTLHPCSSVWKVRHAQSRNFHRTAFFLFFPGFLFCALCCEISERICFLYLVQFSCCL